MTLQIPPLSSPEIFSDFKPSDPGLSRDCVVTTLEKGDTGDGRGCHMMLYGAYTGTDQNESWHWDPVMVLLGQFDGSAFHAEDTASRHAPSSFCAAFRTGGGHNLF